MKIKKLISLLLVFIFVVTSTVNCFSMFGPDIQPLPEPVPCERETLLEHNSTSISPGTRPLPGTLLSERKTLLEHNSTSIGPDIRPLPEPLPPDFKILLEKNRQRIQKLLKDLEVSDAEIQRLNVLYKERCDVIDELNEKIERLQRERDDANRALDVRVYHAAEEGNDVLCTDCICCHNSTRRPVRCITFRSKRFYKGVALGAVVVSVILIGTYVCVYIFANAKK